MYQLFQQLLPLLITLTTGTGVLLHDSRFDRATALAVPVPFSTEDVSDLAMMLRDQHVHTERVVVAGAAQGITISDPSIGPVRLMIKSTLHPKSSPPTVQVVNMSGLQFKITVKR